MTIQDLINQKTINLDTEVTGDLPKIGNTIVMPGAVVYYAFKYSQKVWTLKLRGYHAEGWDDDCWCFRSEDDGSTLGVNPKECFLTRAEAEAAMKARQSQ